MPVKISYTNARGEVAVLDHSEWPDKWLWNIYGSEGLEAPELDYTEVKYGDGSTEIIAINMKPRDVTLYFVVWTGSPALRDKMDELKSRLIQTGTREGDWGQLMIRRPDGRQLYLNCAYTGGFDEFVRKYPHLNKFSLSFHAQDPLFYDGFEQSFTVRQNDTEGYLFFQPDSNPLYMDPNLFMRSAQGQTLRDVYINGDLIYPTIVISGPAENIRVWNKTTGRIIQFASSIALEPGETITIETKNRKRSVIMQDKTGTKTNIMNKLTASSSLNWWLGRGSNNIEFRNSATTAESALKFIYKEGYLSAE